jgi:coronin-1B/1C/6
VIPPLLPLLFVHLLTNDETILSGIDNAAGILMPFYDNDTQVLFLVGKGDGNIRYYEIVDDNNHIYFLSEYKSSVPTQGAAALPKRCVDVNKNEIFRIFKATATNIEPISFVVCYLFSSLLFS